MMKPRIQPVEIDELVKKLRNDNIQEDVALYSIPLAIRRGQKFIIEFTKGGLLRLDTYEDEEISESLKVWFDNTLDHLSRAIWKVNPILEFDKDNPSFIIHCVWDEEHKIAYFYLVTIKTSIYDSVHLYRDNSYLENKDLNFINYSEYAVTKATTLMSTLSNSSIDSFKENMKDVSESLQQTSFTELQSVIWMILTHNCGEVETYFVENEV